MTGEAPSLVFVESFVAAPDVLFARLRAETRWDLRMRARETASFGVPYNYSGIAYPEAPMPPALQHICEQIGTHVGFCANNCLANHYGDGEATMGFHSDSIAELEPGTGVAIVSLGSARTFRFRARADRGVCHDLLLSPGSLLYMAPEVQLGWQHGVPKQPGAGPRISLTFRRLVAKDRLLTPG